MKKSHFCLVVLLFTQVIGAQGTLLNPLTSFPPQVFSHQMMFDYVNDEIQRINPRLPFRLISTPEWADYVNFHHFVPLVYEGVPEGYQFDYNWKPMDRQERIKTVRLPTGEVTEEGKFVVWVDRCNYFQYSEQECRSWLRTLVSHENRHYSQWLEIAEQAVRRVGSRGQPRNAEDLRKIPQAFDEFMKVWSNGPHYQCREVEVFSAQMEAGEMPPTPVFLNTLLVYYKKCLASQIVEFVPGLVRARQVLRAHDMNADQ